MQVSKSYCVCCFMSAVCHWHLRVVTAGLSDVTSPIDSSISCEDRAFLMNLHPFQGSIGQSCIFLLWLSHLLKSIYPYHIKPSRSLNFAFTSLTIFLTVCSAIQLLVEFFAFCDITGGMHKRQRRAHTRHCKWRITQLYSSAHLKTSSALQI